LAGRTIFYGFLDTQPRGCVNKERLWHKLKKVSAVFFG
jgi:hypothetical protein